MFDPSKINLDGNQEEKNENLSEEKDILGEIKTENIDKKEDIKTSQKVEDKQDILSEVKVSETEKVLPNIKTEIQKEEKKSIIFDVNIQSLKDVLDLLIDKEYDFATFEADDEKVEIIFRKDKVIVEKKYIKYPNYSSILLKAKSLTKLNLSETNQEQDGKAEVTIEAKNYDILTRVVPSNFGEKLFLKAQKSKNKEKQLKQKKKSNISQLFSFLGVLLVILLIVGGGFLSFIVLNAKTVEDVKFFTSLGINLSQINSFIESIVFITFSILLFIMTIFLIIFLFKFLLTKKDFRQKKVKYGIASALFFIFTFSTASAWLFVNKKINELPKWDIEARGEVQLYDNAKLKSKNGVFDINGAFIKDTSSLIGPIEIEFDVNPLKEKYKKKGFTIQKYIWNFGGEEVIETTSKVIKKFDKKKIYDISLKIITKNASGEVKEDSINNIKSINIAYLVKIVKKPGKLYSLDATDLKSLGKAEWYNLSNLEKPIYEGYNYITGKPVIKEEIIGLYLRKEGKEGKGLDRVFIIDGGDKSNLDGEIIEKKDSLDDLKYDFSARNLKVDNGAGTVEKFLWTIGDKEYIKDIKDIESINNNWDIKDIENISKITHKFKTYGPKNIKLEIIDSAGNTKIIKKSIIIKQQANLKEGLKIYVDSQQINDINYKPKLGDYYLNNLGIPSKLKFDARFVKPENILYYLDKVSWDYDNDGTIDFVGREGIYDIVKSGGHNIKVHYEFKNRKISSDIIKIVENIYIEAIQKEAIIDFVIKKDSDYVPVMVGFDASISKVKDKNISKFVWDYGDGIIEERDSVVPAHRYTKKGEYEIKLTVITEDGMKYNASKKLVLKPTAQTVKIKPSMKKAPAFQEIDFVSSESSGDIVGYFWDFGDGDTSTEANPSHFFKKPGKYNVKLVLDFRNKNVMEDKIEIEITD